MAFEWIDHTADLGLRVTAPNLGQLFAEAARAVAALIIDNPEAIRSRQQVVVELEAESLEGLFIDWMRELIFRFETDRLLFRECSIQIGGGNRLGEGWRLQAEGRGEPVDWNRHLPGHEVKAVTYHQLRVARSEAGWTAEAIVDL